MFDPAAPTVKAEAIVGGALVTTPVWALALHEVSLVASTVAAVCGAVVGLHAVYRLWKRRRGG